MDVGDRQESLHNDAWPQADELSSVSRILNPSTIAKEDTKCVTFSDLQSITGVDIASSTHFSPDTSQCKDYARAWRIS
jgi:hypothetical protein